MASEGTPVRELDRDLVLSFQGGNEQAYDEIFKRYHGRVWSICRRMLPSAHDAEEATQETFLKAYQALARFNGSFHLGAWLGRIATNVCVDHLRSKAKANLVGLPEEQDDIATERGPEEIVVGDHPRLQRAIQDIQPLHASALALRALEGMSHQEIAGRLEMSPTQVKALLHRARCSLRRAWNKAEGWALAPIFAVRQVVDERATGDAGRLASLSPSAAPFLMEKVAAASAIIVAAALTGFPSAPDAGQTDSSARGGVAAAPFRSQEAPEVLERPAAKRAASSASARAAAPSATAPNVQKTASDLTAEIEKVLKTKKPKVAHSQDQGGDDEDDTVGPTASEGEKTVKKARKAVNDALTTIAP